MLWGMAAGRCEFAGCNKPLWKSSVTQEQVNIAQKAHIYAFSTGGPRGNDAIPKSKLNDLTNLMLVCHECHQKIDRDLEGTRYPAPLLRQWKGDHERRIALATGIKPEKKTHILLCGENIGEQPALLNYPAAAAALFPDRYPADDKPIVLGTINSALHDRDEAYWSSQALNLTRQFDQRVRERLATQSINHLSVFAWAPQPLLILLGTLLSDLSEVDVYQRHREPQTWRWPHFSDPPKFTVREPNGSDGTPVLVLSLSATITDDRITSIIPDAAIWKVTIPSPHNDFTKSRAQLADFRSAVRMMMDRIKARHGQTKLLHVFPAVSVSVAVELGRIRMPKADMRWRIYDQINQRGGFVHALDIP
jgi:hypothetical protein